MVCDMLPQTILYIHENDTTQQIDAFIGLMKNRKKRLVSVKYGGKSGNVMARCLKTHLRF